MVIENAIINMAVSPVYRVQLECNLMRVKPNVLILMSAITIFAILMLHVQIPPVHIVVSVMPDFWVMAIGAKILMSASQEKF